MSETAPELALYHVSSCPFCLRVFSAIDRLGADVELRDIQADPARLRELVEATGRTMVPCLRIDEGGDVRWLHESVDIVRFLEQRVAPEG